MSSPRPGPQWIDGIQPLLGHAHDGAERDDVTGRLEGEGLLDVEAVGRAASNTIVCGDAVASTISPAARAVDGDAIERDRSGARSIA